MRSLDESDASPLAAARDASRAHLRQWLPWLDSNTTVEHALNFIRSVRTQFASEPGYVAGIWFDGSFAGVIGHNRIDRANRVSHVGYWLARSFTGRGIMTRCAAALIRHAYTDLDLNRIVIAVATGNVRSQAIPRRLGFQLEGTLRSAEWLYDRFVDHHIFAQLRDEWQPT